MRSPANRPVLPRPAAKAFVLASLSVLAVSLIAVLAAADGVPSTGGTPEPVATTRAHAEAVDHATDLIVRGQRIFRFDRLGSHVYFSRELKLYRAVRELPPSAALGVGLKVDVEALPPEVLMAIQDGTIDLDDPANTVALILADAVVGVRGRVASNGRLFEVGITCALCHSTVDDSLAPGIGRRLDGWANRDLDVGAILALAPRLEPVADLLGVDVETVRTVLRSWGPGKFDAHLNLDGKAFRPDGASGAVLIPPAFGLAGVHLATYTGWGSVPYWNAFVGNTEMGGTGTFFDPRLTDDQQFPVGATAGFDDQRDEPDLITERLAPLHFYQLALAPPAAPEGSFDPTAAARGAVLFAGRAGCARCHVPPLFTEPGYNLHSPEEIGIDDFQSSRSPAQGYRTTPLRGLWSHQKGGFYHDGRFATLADVLDHYDSHFGLGLSAAERDDLEAYLLSL